MLLQSVYNLVNIVLNSSKVGLNQHPLFHVDKFTSLLFLIIGDINHKNILVLLLLLMELLRRDKIFLNSLRYNNWCGLRIWGMLQKVQLALSILEIDLRDLDFGSQKNL